MGGASLQLRCAKMTKMARCGKAATEMKRTEEQEWVVVRTNSAALIPNHPGAPVPSSTDHQLNWCHLGIIIGRLLGAIEGQSFGYVCATNDWKLGACRIG